jgi:hypothetical protein
MTNTVKTTKQLVIFWDGWPSQWHPSPFEIDGVQYNCCEQYMMAEKARVFGDEEAEGLVMEVDNPRLQKAIGRRVADFDAKQWDSVCRGIVYQGNLAKFEQNPDLRNELMQTAERIIVEASPFDQIWGVGLAPDDPRVLDQDAWRGMNWLGIAVMQVREELKRREGLPSKDIERALVEGQLEARQAIETG